jgi:hypothetical protein
MAHDSMFFIGVFVFIFLMWFVLGGGSRPLSFSGPTYTNGGFVKLPSSSTIVKSGGSASSGSASASPTSRSSATLSYQDQQAVSKAIQDAAFGLPSPYRGKVSLSHYIGNAGNSNPQYETIGLSLPSNAGGPVTISGWSFTSDVTNKGAAIPQGTEVPRSGTINAAEPIVLYPGDRAIISSGRSPIGASFRENLCIGYFAQFQTFSPSLPYSCPLPNSELKEQYGPNLVRDPDCADYVNRISRCQLALSPPPSLTSACQSFLVTYLNYNGCVATHEHDANFLGTTWRIYLDRNTSIWRKTREVVKLLDVQGKTIDMFSY